MASQDQADRATAERPAAFEELLPDDDPEPDLSDLRWIDTLPFLMFWALAVVVFLQFFSRYVLNDSIGWTEEIARYLLIGVAFTGAVVAVRKDTHIIVEFFYRWLPRGLRRVLAAVVDWSRVAFFIAATWFSVELAGRTRQKMASIEVSKAVIYWVVAACFAVMALYALRLAWDRLRGDGGPLVTGEPHEGPNI